MTPPPAGSPPERRLAQGRSVPGSVAPRPGSVAPTAAADAASAAQMERRSTAGEQSTIAASSPDLSVDPETTEPPPGELDDLCGKVIASRYRVLRKMGEGGMGTVYLAEHITIEKKVALKVLLQEYARKADLKERFLQEAKAAARIGHENIVDITDFGDTPDGSVFFAMEFLDGLDLSQMILKHGPMPWSRAKPILLQICRALSAAHAKGIIHRDMKPENIYLIEREGRADFVKVLDFGIAKMSMENSRLTRTGMIFGTPEYMSPEQAQGNKPDHRVDIYAIGVIAYEMLTGHVPFKADTFMGILTKHIFEQPIPPSQMNPDVSIPAEVEEFVLRALNKEREERFQSMAEMAATIAQASGRMSRPTGDISTMPRIVTPVPSNPIHALPSGLSTSEVPEQILRRGRSRMLAGLLVGILLLAGVAIVLSLKREKPTQGPGTAPGKVPPVATTHAIRIRTEPAGVEILQGEEVLGRTPGPITLAHGTRSIILTLRLDGYRPTEVSIVPDRPQVLDHGPLARVTPLSKIVPPRKVEPRVPPRKVEPRVPPRKVEPRVPPKVEPRVPPKVEPRVPPKKVGPTDTPSDLKDPFSD